LIQVHLSTLFALVWATLMLGCQPGAAEKRGELSRLNKAIDDVRLAANSSKMPYMKRLAASSCVHFCELRDGCLLAYERHVEALSLIDQAKRAKRESQLELLDRAESSLKEARDLVDRCAASQGELSLKWRR
jgi:hypothetical protein